MQALALSLECFRCQLVFKLTMELRYPISLAQSATIYALAFMEAGNSWYELKDFEPFNCIGLPVSVCVYSCRCSGC